MGAGDERTNLEIVDGICAALESIRPAAENPALAGRGLARYADLRTFVPDRPGHDRRYAVDATRLTTELGWRPAHRFQDGLRATVAWYLEHRDVVPDGAGRQVRAGAPGPGRDGTRPRLSAVRPPRDRSGLFRLL